MTEILTIAVKHEANCFYASSKDCPGKVGMGKTIAEAILDFVREIQLPVGAEATK
jgi:predicted RNase H-like HicB family nuclease